MKQEKVFIGRDGLVASDDWATPPWLRNGLNHFFEGFNFDPFPFRHDLNKWNAFEAQWGTSNFVNPPYNRDDKPRAVKKAYEEFKQKKFSVLLIPTGMGTEYYHSIIMKNCRIAFIQGRVSFIGFNTKGEFTQGNKGKTDSMIAVFDPYSDQRGIDFALQNYLRFRSKKPLELFNNEPRIFDLLPYIRENGTKGLFTVEKKGFTLRGSDLFTGQPVVMIREEIFERNLDFSNITPG